MGVSWTAGLYYGVVLEPFLKTTKVTKYNPDTGVPYEKSVQVDGYRIPATTDREAFEISLDDLSDTFTDYHIFGGHYRDGKLLGIRVAWVDDGDVTAAKAIPLLMMDDLRAKYHRLITDNFETKPANRILAHSGLTLYLYAS